MRRLWAAGPAIVLCLVLTGAPALAQSGSAGAANEWPFMRTSCPGAAGEPMRLVALGTSETAGWGVRADEAYSPQEAYPARYADILCEELGRPVELHSYFPDQLSNTLAPLAWWNERLSGDAAMRVDLAAADVVVVWALSVHDALPALVFGQCRGEWPDPLRACFEAATADALRNMAGLPFGEDSVEGVAGVGNRHPAQRHSGLPRSGNEELCSCGGPSGASPPLSPRKMISVFSATPSATRWSIKSLSDRSMPSTSVA